MLITVKPLENEKETKVKANVSFDTKDFVLTGFKLYENNEKQLKLLIPSIMATDKNGNPKMTEDGKYINKHPITINNSLSNRNEIFNKLQEEAIKIFKGGDFKEGKASAEVKMPEAEEGSINVKNVWPINPKKVNNNEYQPKASCSVLTGAFRINNVALLFNTKTNDYNIIMPNFKLNNSENQNQNNTRSFSIPKSPEVYAKMKNIIITNFETKQKESLKEYKERKQQQAQVQAQKNSAIKSASAPVENSTPIMK